MDIHNGIMDIHYGIMDIHNSIMDILYWLWISIIHLHLVEERWLKFQYATIATHNAIKDIHN